MSVDATDIDCPYQFLKERYNKNVLRNNSGALMNSGGVGICDDGSLFYQNMDGTSISIIDAKERFNSKEVIAYVNDSDEIMIEVKNSEKGVFSYNLSDYSQAKIFAEKMEIDRGEIKSINKLATLSVGGLGGVFNKVNRLFKRTV